MLIRLICKLFGHTGGEVFRLARHARENGAFRAIEWDCSRCGAKVKALEVNDRRMPAGKTSTYARWGKQYHTVGIDGAPPAIPKE